MSFVVRTRDCWCSGWYGMGQRDTNSSRPIIKIWSRGVEAPGSSTLLTTLKKPIQVPIPAWFGVYSNSFHDTYLRWEPALQLARHPLKQIPSNFICIDFIGIGYDLLPIYRDIPAGVWSHPTNPRMNPIIQRLQKAYLVGVPIYVNWIGVSRTSGVNQIQKLIK